MRFWKNAEIEVIAESTLSDLEKLFGPISKPPIPLDHIIEHVFDLKISWEPIEEPLGQTILGGLRPERRQIVLNEKHIDLFNSKPGLERSTNGHELGHWKLFVDPMELNHPTLFEMQGERFSSFRCQAKEGVVYVLRGLSFDKSAMDILGSVDIKDIGR